MEDLLTERWSSLATRPVGYLQFGSEKGVHLYIWTKGTSGSYLFYLNIEESIISLESGSVIVTVMVLSNYSLLGCYARRSSEYYLGKLCWVWLKMVVVMSSCIHIFSTWESNLCHTLCWYQTTAYEKSQNSQLCQCSYVYVFIDNSYVPNHNPLCKQNRGMYKVQWDNEWKSKYIWVFL